MAGSEPAQNVRPNKEREAEERRLIEAAQSDPERFADVYENYFELVYAYVARRARNRDEAEDLTGEVFRRFAEEKSIREIAGALGRSEGAVKQLQFRALENLRKSIHHS